MGSLAQPHLPTSLAGCPGCPGWAGSSPPEADAWLRHHQLGVGSIAEGAGEQCALGMAKDYTDHRLSWVGLGHGVAHNGLRTHWLLSAGGVGSGSFTLAQPPKRTDLPPSDENRDHHE